MDRFKLKDITVTVLYPEDKTQRYPVVYFHDGQNVFYDKNSFSGHSWRVIENLETKDLPKMIVVAIDNEGDRRMDTYAPWKMKGSPFLDKMKRGGEGDAYGVFIFDTVKPHIDKHYPTKTDKKHTAMIGSSLGGVITAYLGYQYPDRLGHLGVFSLASWVFQKDFEALFENVDSSQRVYIQVGDSEGTPDDSRYQLGDLSKRYLEASHFYKAVLDKFGVENMLVITKGGTHEEKTWAAHIYECLKFISKDW